MATSDLIYRHSRKCASRTGGNCNCEPSIEARVWIPADKRRRTKSFRGKGARSAAKNWLTEARKATKDGKLRASTSKTLRQAVDEFLEGAERGTIRKRGGDEYKPAVIRNYRSALSRHVLPVLGDRRLDAISFTDLMHLQENLQATLSGSTVRNCFVPLQTIYKRAKREGVVAVKPTEDLELGTANVCDRSATPQEAAEAIAALPEDLRPLWATAFYAGLRRGELRALRIENIHETFIDVQHGWDDVAGEQAPKSRAGVRRVPLLEHLRPFLSGGDSAPPDLVFGMTAARPFMPRDVQDRADAAWKAAGLERWTLKECRASFRTWLDASPVSDTRADRYHGHSDGHVRGRFIIPPESQLVEDAALLDAYLSGSASGKVVSLAS